MLENGVQVEGYRIDRLIGEGGMGVVYEATQLSLDRKVALKLLSGELSADAGFRERFRHEARIQGAMDHPNIVTVHEAGESEYGLFIAMELIRGATLKDLIVGRELDAGRTLRILTQVADALDSAHEAGLIHRDIKPHNILVRAGRRDHAFLADFGVTKVRGGTNLTKTGHFVGTVDYMAPEQIRGEPATRETDIYALGTVLYECLSGVVPFPKDSDVAVMYAHLADPPPQITVERPELPPELDAVISCAMAKDPGTRYSSASRMMEAFEHALGNSGRAAVAIPGPVQSPEEIGLREDGQPDTAASPTIRPDVTKAAPTPPPPTEISSEPPMAPPAIPPSAPAGATVAAAGAPPAGATAAAASIPAAPAEAAPPAAPPAEPVERGAPSGLIWGIAAVLVLALAAVGFLVGHSGGKKSASSSSSGKAISVQKATVDVPSGWHEIAAPKIPYLPLRQAVAMAPNGTSGLVMGLASLTYPWNLPITVIGHEVAHAKSAYNSRPYLVQIGRLQAVRASDIFFSQSGKPRYTFIYFPQGKSTTTMAVCYSRGGLVSEFLNCEKAASGITISGAKPYDLVPSQSYAKSLVAALTSLGKTEATGLKTLGAAKTATVQASAARLISKAYRLTAGRLDKIDTTTYLSPANDSIVKALQKVERGYSALAAAASARSSSRYSTASKSITTAKEQLSSAVTDLRSLGYSVT